MTDKEKIDMLKGVPSGMRSAFLKLIQYIDFQIEEKVAKSQSKDNYKNYKKTKK